MKKKLLIVISMLVFISGAKLFAFGAGGGYSVDSGINLELFFNDVNNKKTGYGIGAGFNPITKNGGMAVSLVFDAYYDFLFIDSGDFDFGLELAADVGCGFSMGQSDFAIYTYLSPAVGVKFGVLNGNLDIFARYQPSFIYDGATVKKDGSSASAIDNPFNFLGFAGGVRYHFR